MKAPSIAVVFFTVLLDLVGFGIVLPLLPILSRNFGAGGFMIGAIVASYSVMQFVFSPIWGRLSDRVGRRPVLLVSTACAVASYALFAWGCHLGGAAALWVILLSRMVAGVCGANITVAQAYIADITPPEHRSRRMGLIGMAFGLGFIIGPALGAGAVHTLGLTGPGEVAAALCAANFAMTLFLLGESRRPQGEASRERPHLEQWRHVLSQPAPALLIAVFFLATFCFTCFETTLGLLIGRNFQLNPTHGEDAKTIGYLFAYCGIIGAFVQGGAIGRLVRAWGEPRLIAASLLCTAVGLGPLPFLHGWASLLLFLGILSVGSSLSRPPIFGMLSILTPAAEQGVTIGVAQSMGSLARIAGPVFAGTLYMRHPALLYLVCGGLSLLTAAIAWVYLTRHAPAATSRRVG